MLKELEASEEKVCDFTAVYEKYFNLVCFVLRSSTMKGVDPSISVEDIAQATFLKYWQYGKRYDSQIADIRTYILKIAKNEASSRRQSYHSAKSIDLNLYADHIKDPELQPEEALIQKEEGARVRNAINQLPPTQRTVTAFYDLLGKNHSQISDELGIPIKTCRVHHFRAKQRLKEILQPSQATITQGEF